MQCFPGIKTEAIGMVGICTHWNGMKIILGKLFTYHALVFIHLGMA
jgi:hypothetical protein